jgi:predicted secreted hydrolase
LANSLQSALDPEQIDAFGHGPIRAKRAGDWPAPGPIDLALHDLPHASSTLEWWYVNCHLDLADGREVAIFAAFFRQLASDPRTPGPRSHTHSVAWGISLTSERRHFSKVAVDDRAPQVGLCNLDSGAKHDDERVARAYREVLSRGRIPGPTRMFHTAPRVGKAVLELDYDGDRFEKLAEGKYSLRLEDTKSRSACDLLFSLEKPPTRYGDDGVVHGVSGELMFYYFVPRASVTGNVLIGGETVAVRRGSGWYDHEFGYTPPHAAAHHDGGKAARGETCWRWMSLQLDDRTDVSAFFITRRATGEVLDNWVMLSDEHGRPSVCRDATLETLESWRSTRTFVEYPIALRLRSASSKLDLEVRATFPDQEVITVISDPAFWEGSVRVTGRLRDISASGRGWLECKGFGHADLDEFYSAVGREERSRLSE